MKKRSRSAITVLLAAKLSLVSLMPAWAQPAIGAVGCLIPGVGWVSCTGLVVLGVAGGVMWYQVTYGGRTWKLPRSKIDLTRTYPTPQAGPRPQRPAAMSVNLHNIPGVQEVHWMASETQCKHRLKQLRQQGVNLTHHRFYKANMPGQRNAGHCVWFGPDATENRFADTRYNNLDEYR